MLHYNYWHLIRDAVELIISQNGMLIVTAMHEEARIRFPRNCVFLAALSCGKKVLIGFGHKKELSRMLSHYRQSFVATFVA